MAKSGQKHKRHSADDSCPCGSKYAGGRCNRYNEWVSPYSCRDVASRSLAVRGAS